MISVRVLTPLLVVLIVPACKKSGAATVSPDTPVASPQSPDGAPKPADPDPDAPPACKAGGTVWDGHHDGCLYEVAGCCYPGPKEACAAAGCDEDDCQILESAPAQIRCS